MRVVTGIVLVMLIGSAQAAIYKCKIDGHTAYQSSPCVDGKEMQIEPPPPSYGNSSESLRKAKEANKAVSQRIELSRIARKIKKLRKRNRRLGRDIDSYHRKREAELSSVANTGRGNRFSQMTAINGYWEGKISEAARKIDENRRLIDALEDQRKAISASDSALD